MKKKRIILHILILILAATGIGTGMYAKYHYWGAKPQTEYSQRFQSDFKDHMDDAMLEAFKQYLYRKDFGDGNKVLMKDNNGKDITSKEIIDIIKNDKDYSYYDRISELEEKADEDELNEKEIEELEYNQEMVKYFEEYSRIYHISGIDEMKGEEPKKSIIVDPDSNFNFDIKYKVNGNIYTYSTNSGFDAEDSQYINVCTLSSNKISSVDDKGIMKGFSRELYKVVSNLEYDTDDYDEYGDEIISNDNGGTELIAFADSITECTFADSGKMAMEDYAKELWDSYNKAPESKAFINRHIAMDSAISGTMALICIVIFIYLITIAGHKEKGDVAVLYKIDKLWIDVEAIIVFLACFNGVKTLLKLIAKYKDTYYSGMNNVLIVGIGIVLLIAVELVVLMGESIARRAKCRELAKTTLIYKIVNWIKKAILFVMKNTRTSILIIAFGVINIVFGNMALQLAKDYKIVEGRIIVLALILVAIVFIFKFAKEYDSITDGTKELSDGNLTHKIDGNYWFRSNVKLKDSINNIGEGFNKAVDESIKNERMKTELITNVSHDLKTPLTSIINYVGLLKAEGVKGEKAEKYLEVIDNKSQRLKTLTEDLVEASKLNSGAVTFNREKIDIVQLINQSLGEYEEKFDDKKLSVIKNIQEEPVYIMADGRKTWRVFENLYGNIYKYAMEGTRVYVDVRCKGNKVEVTIKNISATPLDLGADELMERFVRGDKSRTTAGSGLGLSIAKSIVEKQEGSMKVYLDGDLFKVQIIMKRV